MSCGFEISKSLSFISMHCMFRRQALNTIIQLMLLCQWVTFATWNKQFAANFVDETNIFLSFFTQLQHEWMGALYLRCAVLPEWLSSVAKPIFAVTSQTRGNFLIWCKHHAPVSGSNWKLSARTISPCCYESLWSTAAVPFATWPLRQDRSLWPLS